jgi:small-conductance mechanosensitive channel
VAVGVGFGAQNIINNLISSWILMSEKPVRIGDYVEVDQYAGTVERIGNRSTRIRRFDGVHIMVPNSQMLEKIVVNWTLVDKLFRTSVRVGVAYGTPVDRVEQLMTEAAMHQREIIEHPAPLVVFEEFGASSLIFEIHFWCDTTSGAELRGIRSGVRFSIEKLFRENGIEIAYPHSDVHLSTAQPLDVRLHPVEQNTAEARS